MSTAGTRSSHRGRAQGALRSALLSVAILLTLAAPATAKVSGPGAKSYAENYGVPKAVAEERLEAQDRASEAHLMGRLEKSMGPSFAGLWYDNEAGEFVVPILDGTARAQANRAKANGRLAELGLGDNYRTEPAEFSWEALVSAQEQLDASFSSVATPGMLRTSSSVRDNAVIVEIAADATDQEVGEIEKLASGAPVVVELRRSDEPSLIAEPLGCRPFFWAKYCGQPLRGGVGLNVHNDYAGVCTVGFRARGFDAKWYALTAAHCLNKASEPTQHWDSLDEFETPHYIGQLAGFNWSPGDWAKVDATGSYWDIPQWKSKVAKWSAWYEPGAAVVNEQYPINNEANPYEGQIVYHSGFTTGSDWHEVKATNDTIWQYGSPEGPKKLEHLVRLRKGCLYNGDSGGPVYANSTALGLVSSGSSAGNGEEPCHPDNTYWIVKIKEATSNLNVTVVGGPPGVNTNSVTNVQANQATLQGQVEPNGWETNTFFEYGVGGLTKSTPAQSAGSAEAWASKSATITGLVQGATYQYRIRATNALGTTYGAIKTFVAGQTNPGPGGTTGNVTGFPPHQATVTGWVDPNGVTTNYHFQFGTASGVYGGASQLYPAGSGTEPVAVSGTLNNLQGNTTYYYRLVTQNAIGTDYGAELSFTTPLWKPKIANYPPSDVKAGKATLAALIYPEDSATEYRFDWGTEAGNYNLGSAPVPAGQIPSGTSPVWVAEQISGLKGLTTYHYRVQATNQEGTTTTSDQTFTTPDWRPVVTNEKQTDVKVVEEAGQATLHGKINPKGFDTDYRFEWGTQAEFEAGEYNHSAPVPDGDAGSGESDVAVSATMRPIKGETTYHYRLVAENVEGKSQNVEDRSFTTPNWRPGFSFVRTSEVDRTSATLIAPVDPRGFATTFHFEWGPTEAYGNSAPVPDQSLGSATSVTDVALPVDGLSLGQDYHFRLVAANAEGTTISDDEVFRTSASGFTATDYTAQIVAAPFGGTLKISTNLGTIVCDPQSLTGETGAEVEKLTMDVADSSCEALGIPGALEMNGCKFTLDPGAAEGPSYAGELLIGPAGCGPVTIAGPTCDIEIHPQAGLPVDLETQGEGSGASVQLSSQAGGLKYDLVGCGGAGTFYNGAYSGNWSLTATNSAGEAIGLSLRPDFPGEPGVTIGGAGDVDDEGAVLHASIDPEGSATSYHFEYGPDLEYGSSVPVPDQGIGSGGEPVEVSEQITDLDPGATYHFRVVASNALGTAYSGDATLHTWNSWSAQEPPNPQPRTEAKLGSVSCPSASLCVAVGKDNYTGRSFGQAWDGSEWETVLTDRSGAASGISCPSTTRCTAVGSSNGVAVAENWNYVSFLKSWGGGPVALAQPEGGTGVALNDVSCTATSACTAVGSYYKDGKTKTLAERWNGSSWSIQATPNPESGNAELLGVSCDTASSCTAVGKQGSSTLALRWNGTSWSSASTPNPEGASESVLADVSCPASSSCTAVGWFKEGGAWKKGLAEAWNGTSWSLKTVPSPEGAVGNVALEDVSCASAGSCAAAGFYGTQKGVAWDTETETLIQSWGGSQWAVQSSPGSPEAKFDRLAGVSCGSSTACTAVGAAGPGADWGDGTVTLAARYE